MNISGVFVLYLFYNIYKYRFFVIYNIWKEKRFILSRIHRWKEHRCYKMCTGLLKNI